MSIDAGFAAVLPLLGVLVGAGLHYFFGRSLEAEKRLTLQKAQAYADYFKSIATLSTQGRSKEALAQAADAKTRMCIYGSPDVVRCLGDFERSGSKVSEGDGQKAIAEIMKAMRRDLGVSAKGVLEVDIHRILFGPPTGTR